VISTYKGHHKCAATEKLYLPRSVGIVSLENLWEREQISVVRYLQRSDDKWLKGLHKFMTVSCETNRSNPVAACRTIVRKYGIMCST